MPRITIERPGELLDEKTVRVSTVFRPKDGEDEREEDRHDGEADERLNSLLSPGVGVARRRRRRRQRMLPFGFFLWRSSFNENDHSYYDGAVNQSDEVGFNHELGLTAAVDVGHLTGLRISMQHRRAADVVPHLTGCHGENDADRADSPRLLVVQEFQIVASDVEQNGDEAKEQDDEDGR